MDRSDFTRLREMPDKIIRSDIRFVPRKQTLPALICEGIEIENSAALQLRLNVNFNPEVGSKTFNVYVMGLGPICRLDVDGPVHQPAGRCHKHSLQTERCPELNLPTDLRDRPDLTGKPVSELFATFCEMAKIKHLGTFFPPPV